MSLSTHHSVSPKALETPCIYNRKVEEERKVNTHLTKLPDKLSTHPTRTRRRRNIRRYSEGFEVTSSFAGKYCGGNGHAFGTGAYGVGCVLHVGALDDFAAAGEEGGADLEFAVGACLACQSFWNYTSFDA